VKIRLSYLAVAICCIGIGLLFRAPVFGLPWAVAKYGGSILWAAMVYCGARVLMPAPRVLVVAIVAGLMAAVGEFTQLISLPGFDELRETWLGHLIFGRTFALEDIAAYWIGIAVAATIDHLARNRETMPIITQDK